MQQAARTRAEEIVQGLYPHQIEGVAFLLGRRREGVAERVSESIIRIFHLTSI